MLNIDNQILEASNGGALIIKDFISSEKIVDSKAELPKYGTRYIISKSKGVVTIKEYEGRDHKKTYPSMIEFVMKERRCSRIDAYSRICVRLGISFIDLVEKSILDLTNDGKDLIEGWIRCSDLDPMENKFEVVSYKVPVTEVTYKDAKGNLIECNSLLDFVAKVNNKGGKLGALDIVLDTLFLIDCGVNYDEYERMSPSNDSELF